MDAHAVRRSVEGRADDTCFPATSIALPITQAAAGASAATAPTRRQSSAHAVATMTPEMSTEQGYVQRSRILIAVTECSLNGR